MATLVLKNSPADVLGDALAPLLPGYGQTPRLARRLLALTVKHGTEALPDELNGVARRIWTTVREQTRVPNLELLERQISACDGFAKYLFRGGDGAAVTAPFEAVRIPLMHRPGDEKYVVCVSSQVGCAVGCAFCATGRLGQLRQLSPWEIVDQVVKVQADSEQPVRGVVFMGMGEPLLNYRNVMDAARVLSDPSGMAIDAKAITISTAGVAPMMRRFTREKRPYRLILSLHSARPEVRDALVPLNRNYPLPEIIDALREYQDATGKRVLLAWTMIAGVNMNAAEVQALAKLTKGLRIVLDLIPVNDATGRYQPPGDAEYGAFLDMLRAEVACPIVRRYSGGKDIHGACGMLAGRTGKEQTMIDPCINNDTSSLAPKAHQASPA